MAGGFGYYSGGIIGLLLLHDEHPEAVEHEFIRLGLRWRNVGTDELTWRDALVIISQAEASGALARSKYPEFHEYFHRAAEMILYEIRTLQVLHGNASKAKKSDFPEVPEWAKDKTNVGGQKGNALPFEELQAFLDSFTTP